MAVYASVSGFCLKRRRNSYQKWTSENSKTIFNFYQEKNMLSWGFLVLSYKRSEFCHCCFQAGCPSNTCALDKHIHNFPPCAVHWVVFWCWKLILSELNTIMSCVKEQDFHSVCGYVTISVLWGNCGKENLWWEKMKPTIYLNRSPSCSCWVPDLDTLADCELSQLKMFSFLCSSVCFSKLLVLFVSVVALNLSEFCLNCFNMTCS